MTSYVNVHVRVHSELFIKVRVHTGHDLFWVHPVPRLALWCLNYIMVKIIVLHLYNRHQWDRDECD